MPYQPNLLAPQLEGGIPLMQLGGGQTVFQTPQGTPFIYSAISQPGPTDMGNQIANAITQVLAPLIARMSGMQNPQFAPNIGAVQGGISPWAGYYMRDVQRPLYEASRDQYLWQWGGNLGSMANQALSNAIGESAITDRARQQITSLAQGPAGRSITQLLMSTSGVQSVLGGDYLQMFDTIYGNRQNLRGPVGMAPMDLDSQRTLANQTADLVTNLTKSMVGPGGVPNYAFTRGFDPTSFGMMTQYLGQRGAAGFAGVYTPNMNATPQEQAAGYNRWQDYRKETLGQTAKALEAISELVGGAPTEQLIGALDRLAQGVQRNDWNAAVTRIGQQVQSISSAAKTFGISGQQAMQMVEGFQTSMGLAVGVSPMNPLGLSAGGYNSPGVAGQLATIAMATADVMGVRGDPAALSRITAQQSALMVTAMQSRPGLNAQMMGWAASTGRITPDQWSAYNQAVRAGEFERAAGMTESMLRDVWGDPATGRQIMMNAMPYIRSQTSEDYRLAVTGTVQQGMSSQLARDMGRAMTDETHRRAMLGLNAMGMVSGDQGLIGTASMEAALARIQQVAPGFATAARGRATSWQDLQQFIQGEAGLRDVRDDVLSVANRAGKLREAQQFVDIAPKGSAAAAAVQVGITAAGRINRMQTADALTRLTPTEVLASQTALTGWLADIQSAPDSEARARAVQAALQGIGSMNILSADERSNLINQVQSGADLTGVLKSEEQVRKGMELGEIRRRARSGEGPLADANELRAQGERRAKGLGSSIALQAMQEQRFNDMMQSMRMPFGQRLWSAIAGTGMTGWGVLGISEEAYGRILTPEQRGDMESAVAKLATAKEGMDMVSTNLQGLVSGAVVQGMPGAAETMINTSKHVAEAARSGDSKQVEQSITAGVTALKNLSYKDKDGQTRTLPSAEIEKWVTNQRALVGATTKMGEYQKDMQKVQLTDDQLRKLGTSQLLQKYRDQRMERDAQRTLASLDIDLSRDRTAFLGDISPDMLGKPEVRQHLETLLSGREKGALERWSFGMIVPTTASLQEQALELSKLPKEEWAKYMTGPGREEKMHALAELGKLADADSRRRPEGKEAAGKGKERVDLVGTLMLYDGNTGVNIGIVKDVRNRVP